MIICKDNKILKQFSYKKINSSGRNHFGRITVRGRGGSRYKHCYYLVDFGRFLWNTPGLVCSVHYDPNRNCFLGLVSYIDFSFSLILLPEGLFPGDIIISGNRVKLSVGNHTFLKNIPIGLNIFNIELYPRRGGQLVRSAGCFARIVKKTTNHCVLELNSSSRRIVLSNYCSATIGRVSNRFFSFKKLWKAGQRRNLNFRPIVRGVAKNPCDHPHGGGEGKKSSNRISRSPWGRLNKGTKTSNARSRLKRNFY